MLRTRIGISADPDLAFYLNAVHPDPGQTLRILFSEMDLSKSNFIETEARIFKKNLTVPHP